MKKLIGLTIATTLMITAITIIVFFRGENINMEGKILLTGALKPDDNLGLYSISLHDNSLKEIFLKDYYENLRFPYMKNDESIILVGKNNKNNYVLLEIKENSVEEIYTSVNEIYHPWVNKGYYYFIEKLNDNKSKIIKYDSTTDTQTVLLQENFDYESKPIINNKDEIYFVTKNNKTYSIKLLKNDGSIRDITEGRYPLLKTSTELIYFNNRTLNILELESKKVNQVKRHITLIDSPIIISDSKYILFYEIDYPYGVAQVLLSIMDVENGKKQTIKGFNFGRYIIPSGLAWQE